MRTARIVSVLSCLLLGTGCLDLSLPSKPPTDPGPTISFLAPLDGQKVSLQPFISLDVQAARGVQSVTLTCNHALTLQTWSGPPYESNVDLSGCVQRGADASTQATITLDASGVDSNQAQSTPVSVTVEVDVTAPALSTTLPARVAPFSTLAFTISSNQALIGVPTVHVDGQPATVSGSGTLFTVTWPTPGLGIDLFDGGADADVPLEVLEQTERTLPVVIDARGTNGNPITVTLQTQLSRVLWQRLLPAQPCSLDGFSSPCVGLPHALGRSAGLTLALQAGQTVVLNAGVYTGTPSVTMSVWSPAFLSAEDGTITSLDVSDGGYFARGIDRAGRVLLQQATTGALRLEDVATGAVVMNGLTTWPVDGNRLTPVGDELCEGEGSYSLVSFAPRTSVACVGPDGGPPPFTSTQFGFGSGGNPTAPPIEVSSGDSYLAYAQGCVGTCANYPAFFIGGPLAGPPQWQQPLASPGDAGIETLLPTDGGFVVQYVDAFGTPITDLLDGDGGFVQGLPIPTDVPRQVVFAWPDQRILTLRAAPPYTIFEVWGASPTAFRIPGSWVYAGEGTSPISPYSPVPGRNVVLGPGGLVSILLKTSPQSYDAAVLTLDPKVGPRWLYRYPNLAFPNSVELIADEPGSDLYLLDELGNYAVALGH